LHGDVCILQEIWLKDGEEKEKQMVTQETVAEQTRQRKYTLYRGPADVRETTQRAARDTGIMVAEDIKYDILTPNDKSYIYTMKIYGNRYKGHTPPGGNLYVVSFYAGNESDALHTREEKFTELANTINRWKARGDHILVGMDGNLKVNDRRRQQTNWKLLQKHIIQPHKLQIINTSVVGDTGPTAKTGGDMDVLLATESLMKRITRHAVLRGDGDTLGGSVHYLQYVKIDWEPIHGDMQVDKVVLRYNNDRMPHEEVENKMQETTPNAVQAWLSQYEGKIRKSNIDEATQKLHEVLQAATKKAIGQRRVTITSIPKRLVSPKVQERVRYDRQLGRLPHKYKVQLQKLNGRKKQSRVRNHIKRLRKVMRNIAKQRKTAKRSVQAAIVSHKKKVNARIQKHLHSKGQVSAKQVWAAYKRYESPQSHASTVMEDDNGKRQTGAAAVNVVKQFWERMAKKTDGHWNDSWTMQIDEKFQRTPPEEQIEDTQQRTSAVQQAQRQLNQEPTLEEVESAIKRLKYGKAAGNDGILPFMYKHADTSLSKALHHIIVTAWREKITPEQWNHDMMIPIHKKGDKTKPSNYRPLSWKCTAAKVMGIVLNQKLQRYLENTNQLPEEQYGFRQRKSTAEAVQLLRMILQYRRHQQRYTYVAFIDLRKAFDLVWREGLWEKLLQLGVDGHYLAMLRVWYAGSKTQIRWNGKLSEWYEKELGVIQGDILSPLLFLVFINGLIMCLKAAGIGVKVKGKWLGGIFFCDDISLQAEDPNALQQMLDTVTEYCTKWHIQIGHNKTQIMVCTIPKHKHQAQPPLPEWPAGGFTVGYKTVTRCKKYKHLGKWVQEDGSNEVHANRVVQSYKYRLGLMKRTAKYLGGIPVIRAREMMLVKLMPIREYVAGVVQLTKQQQTDANRIWRKAARWATTMADNISAIPLMADMRLPVMEYRDLQYIMHMYKTIYTKQLSGEDRPVLWMYQARLEQLMQSKQRMQQAISRLQERRYVREIGQYAIAWRDERNKLRAEVKYLQRYNQDSEQWWPLKAEQACCRLGLQNYWEQPQEMEQMPMKDWKRMVAVAVEEKSKQWYVRELNRDGHHQLAQAIQEMPLTNRIANYLLLEHLPSRMLMTMIRARSLPTQSCRQNVQYKRIWNHTGECWVCDDGKEETVHHLFLECPSRIYQSCRRREGFPGVISEDQLNLFANHTVRQAKVIAKMVWNIWVLRWWMLTGEALGKYSETGEFEMEEILMEHRVERGGVRQRDVNEYLTVLTPLGNPQTGESSGSVNSQAESTILSHDCSST